MSRQRIPLFPSPYSQQESLELRALLNDLAFEKFLDERLALSPVES